MLNPISLIDKLLRTTLLVGAILIAAIMIKTPSSWDFALVVITFGFFSFFLASQFLITLVMEHKVDNVSLDEKARSLRLFIPFMVGFLCYLVGIVFICLNSIAL